MSNNIVYSADYNNDQISGLFDRIINIRFIRKNGESFTLRSDYEPVWEGGKLTFKTCQPKPAIRVQYTQYQSTTINVDIFVTNLNIIEFKDNKAIADSSIADPVRRDTKSGNTTNLPNDLLTRQGNPVVKAEIEMGYRGQFYNWSQEDKSGLTQEQRYQSFLNLERPSVRSDRQQFIESQSFLKEHRRCTITVEWAIHTSNPPDRITQFHGYVGSTEAGFQPYSNQALDNVLPGTVGQITQNDIFKSLNDDSDPVDAVPVRDGVLSSEGVTVSRRRIGSGSGKEVVDNPASAQGRTTGTTVMAETAVDRSSTHRNFFNGGNPFTLLEGYCFHTITRRFIRPGIDAKRNSLLEQAALEYQLATIYPGAKQQLAEKREELKQLLFMRERRFTPEFIAEEGGIISYSKAAPEDFIKRLEKWINDKMIEFYIGARYTIKNLPDQRKFYTAIRKTLKNKMAEENYKYLSWSDAASMTSVSSSQTEVKEPSETLLDKDIQKVRQYMFDAENGLHQDKYFYFSSGISKDWVLPLQNSESGMVLKDSSQRNIIFHPPSKLSATGFEFTDKSVTKTAKCFSGLFEVRDAYMFGLPVICTEKASQSFAKQQAGNNTLAFKFHANPQAQIEWICNTWNLLYYTNDHGGFYIYDPSEDERDMASQEFVTNQSSTPFKIPAVYDITLGPIRKIRMPFIAFLNPMRLVEWNSSASIGEMISFYYQPAKGRNFFMTISNTIDFSTVEDYNTMEISMTDTQWRDRTVVPPAIVKQDEKKTFVEVLIIPDEQTDTWQKIYNSAITKIPASLVQLWADKTSGIADDNRVTGQHFFTLMQRWNPGLFALSTEAETGWSWVDGIRRVDKKANKLYGEERPDKKINFPDINFCFTKITDAKAKRLYMKFPLLPEEADYSKMDEYDKIYIMVYRSGAWTMQLKELVRATYQIEVV